MVLQLPVQRDHLLRHRRRQRQLRVHAVSLHLHSLLLSLAPTEDHQLPPAQRFSRRARWAAKIPAGKRPGSRVRHCDAVGDFERRRRHLLVAKVPRRQVVDVAVVVVQFVDEVLFLQRLPPQPGTDSIKLYSLELFLISF